MSDEILPCPNPWCDDRCVRGVDHREGGFFRVSCTCGVGGPAGRSEKQAVTLWNTRAPTKAEEDAHRLLDCLGPFVPKYEDWMEGRSDDERLWLYADGQTYGQLRRAHQVLKMYACGATDTDGGGVR
jgi:hypothetical protein